MSGKQVRAAIDVGIAISALGVVWWPLCHYGLPTKLVLSFGILFACAGTSLTVETLFSPAHGRVEQNKEIKKDFRFEFIWAVTGWVFVLTQAILWPFLLPFFPFLAALLVSGAAGYLAAISANWFFDNARGLFGRQFWLRLACRKDWERLMRLTLKLGANAAARDGSGVPMLMHTLNRGRDSSVTLLLDAGADPNATMEVRECKICWEPRGGQTPVSGPEGTVMVNAMPLAWLEEPFPENLVGWMPKNSFTYGWPWPKHNPLSIVAHRGRLSTAELLVKKGANPNMLIEVKWLTGFQMTRLMMAAIDADKNAVRVLLAVGADPFVPIKFQNEKEESANIIDLLTGATYHRPINYYAIPGVASQVRFLTDWRALLLSKQVVEASEGLVTRFTDPSYAPEILWQPVSRAAILDALFENRGRKDTIIPLEKTLRKDYEEILDLLTRRT